MLDGGKLTGRLQRLLAYLIDTHGLPASFAKMRVVRSVQLDKDNEHDPRAFCAVREEEPNIVQASLALGLLPVANQFGVLYHEIGHFGAKAFGRDCEPKVDAWCLDFAPELNYRYESVKYTCVAERIAANIQRIDFK